MKKYRPSSLIQRKVIVLLSVIGTSIAVYLGLYEWHFISYVWDPIFGADSMLVLNSKVSTGLTRIIRLPDAILGAIAFFADIAFALAGSEERWRTRPWLVLLFGAYIIPPGLVSFTLVVLQAIAVKAWCFCCLITASLSFSLIFLAYGEVFATLEYLYRVWKRAGFLCLWNTICAKGSQEALEVSEEMIQRKENVGKNL